jgi:hypothetical protein
MPNAWTENVSIDCIIIITPQRSSSCSACSLRTLQQAERDSSVSRFCVKPVCLLLMTIPPYASSACSATSSSELEANVRVD